MKQRKSKKRPRSPARTGTNHVPSFLQSRQHQPPVPMQQYQQYQQSRHPPAPVPMQQYQQHEQLQHGLDLQCQIELELARCVELKTALVKAEVEAAAAALGEEASDAHATDAATMTDEVAAGAKPEVAGTVLPAAASASAADGATDANADTSGGANKHAAKWEENFAELLEYKRTHGDCLVKYNYEANPKLAGWVNRQRKLYKQMTSGKKSQMTQERVQKLQEVGFVFSLRGGGAGGGKAGGDGDGAGGDEDSAYYNQVQTSATAARRID